MYRLVHERSGYKLAGEKLFIAKFATVTVFRASRAGEGVSSVAASLGPLSDAVSGVASSLRWRGFSQRARHSLHPRCMVAHFGMYLSCQLLGIAADASPTTNVMTPLTIIALRPSEWAMAPPITAPESIPPHGTNWTRHPLRCSPSRKRPNPRPNRESAPVT